MYYRRLFFVSTLTIVLLTLLFSSSSVRVGLAAAEPVLSADDSFSTDKTPYFSGPDSPLMLTEQKSQVDALPRFFVQTAWGTIWLAEDGLSITLREGLPSRSSSTLKIEEVPLELEDWPLASSEAHLALSFVGADPAPSLEAFDNLGSTTSPFLGPHLIPWPMERSLWGGVRYVDLYPGVDLEISSDGERLNWQLVVRNSQNTGNEELLQGIALHVEGADVLMLDDEWLRLATPQGEYTIPLLQVSGVEAGEIPSATLADKQVTAPFVPSSSNPPANNQNAPFFDLFSAAVELEMSDEPDDQVVARGAEMRGAQALASPTPPEVRLAASDGAEADYFGYSVSVDGDRALVGAYGSDTNGSNSGAAYIYHWDGTNWVEEAKLLPSDGAAGDYFGYSVSLSGDRAFVGASGNRAYIFHWDGTTWSEEAKLLASDGAAGDSFGLSVSLDGDRALVGAFGDDDNGPSSGSAYLFAWDGTTWVEEAKLLASDGAGAGYFGSSVSLDGDRLLVGAFGDDDNGSFSGAAYLFAWDGSTWSQEAKLLASDGADFDFFGYSLALSGDRAFIGASRDDDNGTDSGAAYLFHWDGTSWGEETKLLASDVNDNDHFGFSVSLSDNRALVGAYNGYNGLEFGTGAAYLFRWHDNSWLEEAKLFSSDGASGDYFGYSVSLSGNQALVGAYQDDDSIGNRDVGSAYLYDLSADNVSDILISPNQFSVMLDTSTNITTQTLTVYNVGTEPLNWSISSDTTWITFTPSASVIAPDGSLSIALTIEISDFIGGPYNKLLTMTSNDPDEATIDVPLFLMQALPESKLTASDGSANRFGRSVSVDKNYAAVGAPSSEAVYLFRWDGTTWLAEGKLVASDGVGGDYFGDSVSLNGDRLLVGAPFDDDNGLSSGAAYLFRWDGTNWLEEAKLLPSDGANEAYFGSSVSLSGDRALIGAYGASSAYLFQWDGTTWVQEANLLASDGAASQWFGFSVSLSGDRALIGAYRDDDNGSRSGSAYLFHWDGTDWVEEAKLLASDGDAYHNFGYSVSLSGERALIGAYGDDDNGSGSGSAYLFSWDGTTWLEETKLLPSDGRVYNFFGYSVSLDGERALVGNNLTSEVSIGPDFAYLFEWNGSGWTEEVKLFASDGFTYNWFGTSVSLSDEHVLVSIEAKEMVYAYHLPSNTVTCDNIEVTLGDPIPVDLIAEGTDIYGLQANCVVDPTIAQPQSATFADFFDSPYLVGVNQADAAAGTWLGAASQQNPNPPVSGSGTFATITYQAISPGTTDVTCDSLFSDRNGFEIPGSASGSACTITVLDTGSISGTVTYQGRLTHAGIEVTATGPVVGTDMTDAAGDFLIEQLQGGSYNVEADAHAYLPTCTTTDVTSGQISSLPQAQLMGGDVAGDSGDSDGDGDYGDDVINIGDATLVSGAFGSDDAQADINADGTINVQDLSILGGNYELTGCQDW